MLEHHIHKWVWAVSTNDMDRSVGQKDDKEQIEAEAAEWVIRLGGKPMSPHEHKSFEVWCSRSESHVKALEFARQTWSDLAGLRQTPDLLDADRAPSRQQKRPYQPVRAPIVKQRSDFWQRSVMAAICLIVAATAVSFWYGNPVTLIASDYYTTPGEQSTVKLSDGSVVELSTNSAIALHFSDQERRVTLIKGAAYFTVAPMGSGEKRPFVVEGVNGTATALGTQFAMERLSDTVEVTVAEHEVRVELSDAAGDMKQVVLSPGQSVRYSRATGLGQVSLQNVEQATAWRRGRLVFDQVTLAEVVAELNRYRRGRIVISDSTLANRRVSGVFQINDLDNALSTISSELGLRSTSVPHLVTVLY